MFPRSSFQQVTGIEKYLVEERFYSKKNEVYRVRCLDDGVVGERILVVKNYLQPKSKAKKEVDLLKLLREKGVSVPKIFMQQDQYIIMEYIEGKTLVQAIEEREACNKLEEGYCYQSNRQLIRTLTQWMSRFYQYTNEKIILKDINLRNFIIDNNGTIYGFDFEDCDIGEIEEDVAKICAYMLTYDPPFTSWKLEFVKEAFYIFAEKFHIDQGLLLKKVEEEIRNINMKRGRNFSVEVFNNIIE